MTCCASRIAAFLECELRGPDVEVQGATSLDGIVPGALVFAKSVSAERIRKLNSCPGAVALVTPEFAGQLEHSHIVVTNPRLAFARATQEFFTATPPATIAATAVIDPSAVLGAGVSVGEYAIIGPNVRIGDSTQVRHHAVISAGSKIGRNCLIKSHVVMGEDGFGFELDDDGIPVRIPHLGSVVIGDEVEVGAGTVIARGTLDSTRVGDRAKIDDAVFIAHNVIVGEDTLIIANAEVSGSVRIGAKCWIGPSVSVLNGIRIGDGSLIGLGAVVTRDVPPNVVVVGNPGRVLRQRRP